MSELKILEDNKNRLEPLEIPSSDGLFLQQAKYSCQRNWIWDQLTPGRRREKGGGGWLNKKDEREINLTSS